jgi:hypothetical protein
MKILFHPLMPIDLKASNAVSDYQSDMMFHGLVKSLGKNTHTHFDLWWHDKDTKDKNPELFSDIWGSGFTMYGLLDEEEYTRHFSNDVDEYDAVVIPIHHTMNKQDQSLKSLLSFFIKRGYEKNQLIVIDGWDQEYINKDIAKSCTYYKREMKDHHEEYALPISFAMPKEKIRKLDDSKRNVAFAPLIPVNQSVDPSYMSTYIYDTEESYYDMYQTAHFSYTSKKGGWDTLRHYEIIANGSIPFFVDMEECPKHTLWNLPKDKLIQAKYLLGGVPNLTEGQWQRKSLPNCGTIDKENPGYLVDFRPELWKHFRQEFYDWLNREATTEALAQRVLGNI